MSQHRKGNPSRLVRWAFAILLAVMPGVVLLRYKVAPFPTERQTVFSASCGETERVELVLVSEALAYVYLPVESFPWIGRFDALSRYSLFVCWHRRDGSRASYIAEVSDHLPYDLELRASGDLGRPSGQRRAVWLTSKRKVLAALELDTGAYVNYAGWRVDPSWSRRRQIDTMEGFWANGETPRDWGLPWGSLPPWAVAGEGRLLASAACAKSTFPPHGAGVL